MSDSEFGHTTPTNDVLIGIGVPQSETDFGSNDTAVSLDYDHAPGDEMGVGTTDRLSDIPQVYIAEDTDDDLPVLKGSQQFDPTAANPASGNIGNVLPLGTNADGSHFFTGIRNVDATLIGSKWGTTNLTFSFPTSGTNYNGATFDSNGVSNYHIDLGTQQQAAARAAFAQLSAATGLTFTEITDTDTVHANIRISQSGDADVASAYGNFPSDTKAVAGDIWFGRTSQPYYDLAFKGTWGYATMMHEIGHTMGLKHGHQDYTNSDLSFYFGTTPRVGTQSLTADRDGQAWSLMTYTPAPFTNSNFAGEKINQPQTYMQYDLAALQYLYGANFATNATDSVYTFSQTTGEMSINGVGQGAPSGNKIFLTIWDGGGNDTIDVSNYANGVTVDLRPGEFSTVDQSQLANNLAYQNLVNLAPGNFAMSLLYNNDTASLIENVKGGAGNDIFVGNSANNVLDGGAGSDTVIFTGQTGINVTLNDTGADVIVSHDGETDTLRSIENIQGTVGNDTLTGNAQNNTFSGGIGGADTLSGLGGDDRLIGGGFTIVNTAILTKSQTDNNLNAATAIDPQASNAYTLVSNANITSSTVTPHATINATATGGGLEYYRVDAAAGSTAIFDIDNSSIDTWIELVDSTGRLIAQNDDSIADAGSSTGNSYLTYTFTTAGAYYIRVGRWTAENGLFADPLTAGTTYQLHISLSTATVNATPLQASNTSSLVADGGEGNDFVQGTLGNDTLVGGNGTDTVSFATAFSNTSAGITFSLAQQGTAQNTGAAGTDTISGFENVIGSQYGDTITGDSTANVIEGGLGNDTLNGGFGNDTASYAGATAGVTVSLGLQGGAQNTIAAGTDTLIGFENLLGSAFNDTLTGSTAENILSGGAGDDTLNPGTTASGVQDLLDGGDGSDTASFAGQTTGVTATLNGASDGTASIAGAQIATLRSIENLRGGDGADLLTGDAGNNVIEGGLGDDTLVGGLGIDTLAFTGATAVTVNLATLAAQNTGWGMDTISGFENVRTGSGADNVTGDGNDNTFFDGGGADAYSGAAGSDTVDYTNIVATLTVNLNTAGAQSASTGGDILSGIENVTGSLTAANNLTGGNTTSNRLVGGAGVDFLIGGGLDDTLIGGAGNDVIFGDYVSNFSTTVGQADGNDVLEGGTGSDSLVGGLGADILRGGDGDDLLVGGIAAGTSAGLTQVFTNDGGGADVFDGGDGTDTAYAYYTDQTGGIAFDLANLAGNSAITMGGAAYGSFTSVERVIFRGGTGNDVVKGGGTLDTLVGNAGDDVLDGWYGNDTLSGGLGNDTLIGGEGLDTATYVNAIAGVNVDLRIAGGQDTIGDGIDTLVGIEYLTGSAFGDTLRGDDDFNLLIDNSVATGGAAFSQTDSLFGYGGNDTISVTRAQTDVATNVNMDGGDGDDLIQLVSGTVTLTTSAAPDPDGLSSGVFYALPGRAGTRALDNVTVNAGSGNDRVVLTGVDAAVVDLGTGNDILSISTLGAAGFNDYDITTGTGQDIIQLAGTGAVATTTTRANVVRDFTVGDAGDRFELRNATGSTFAATSWVNTTNFTGLTSTTQNMFTSGHLRLVQDGDDMLLQADRDGTGAGSTFVTIARLSNGYTGGFTAFNFDGMIGNLTLTGIDARDETLTGSSGNDTLSGGDGNDTLIGLDGDDTLDGGNGNDLLDGGNGNDLLRGGAGDDTLIGGAGTDTATYSDAAAGVTVNLSVTAPQVTGGSGTDTLSGIENLIGSGFADMLAGDASANVIDGGAGDDTIVGGAGADTLYGGDGNDRLEGGDDSDTLYGGIGNDQLYGGSGVTVDNLYGGEGNDTAFGGAGNDYINGEAGDDVLSGDLGDDLVLGGAGADTLYGADGNDRLEGGDDSDTLFGGSGNDLLYGGAAVDLLFGGDGNDVAYGGDGADTINGEGGDDVLSGDLGDDTIVGGAGADTLYGGDGNDRLEGGDDSDTLYGGIGNDQLYGGSGVTVDNLYGGEGNDTAFGGAGNDYINGEAGDDVLSGDLGDDLVLGGAGADTLYGADGNDRLEGGDDSDTLFGGSGNDLLYGGAAVDLLFGGDGNDVAYGGDGADTINGEGGDDILSGDLGDDTILGGAGADTLFGGDGNDRLEGGNDSDTLYGGAGNDQLYGGGGIVADFIFGGEGNDTAFGGNGADVLNGENGDDILYGDLGDDTVLGGNGVDTLYGGDGNDRLEGGNDNDTLFGGAGNDLLYGGGGVAVDILYGGDGDDIAYAGNGNDFVYGENNNDILYGDLGNDSLFGGEGNDTLVGGQGNDTLTGGTGADIFLYTATTDAPVSDTITDFSSSEGDKIDLTLIDANTLMDGNQDFTFIGTNTFSNTAGELRFQAGAVANQYDVYGDVDGNGSVDFHIVVTKAEGPLVQSDFLGVDPTPVIVPVIIVSDPAAANVGTEVAAKPTTFGEMVLTNPAGDDALVAHNVPADGREPATGPVVAVEGGTLGDMFFFASDSVASGRGEAGATTVAAGVFDVQHGGNADFFVMGASQGIEALHAVDPILLV